MIRLPSFYWLVLLYFNFPKLLSFVICWFGKLFWAPQIIKFKLQTIIKQNKELANGSDFGPFWVLDTFHADGVF